MKSCDLRWLNVLNYSPSFDFEGHFLDVRLAVEAGEVNVYQVLARDRTSGAVVCLDGVFVGNFVISGLRGHMDSDGVTAY